MYIPKELIWFIIGYICCPITAYIYIKVDDNKKRKKFIDNAKKIVEEKEKQEDICIKKLGG